jgi:hypothetical protein
MSDQKSEAKPIEWLERLRAVHRSLHNTMAGLVERKDYSSAETLLRVTDRLLLDLIRDAGGRVEP